MARTKGEPNHDNGLSGRDRQTMGNPVGPKFEKGDPSKVDPMFTKEDRVARDAGKPGSRSETKAGGVAGKRAAETRKKKSARET